MLVLVVLYLVVHILSVPSFYDLGSREVAVITVYLFCIVEGIVSN